MAEKKPKEFPKRNDKRSDFDKKPGQYSKRNANRNYKDNRRGYDNRRDYDNSRRRPQRPRNIRYGTKFCGECRACEFWVTAKFGRFRCENSYLPFEILEFRRDGNNNQINEIVLNLLV